MKFLNNKTGHYIILIVLAIVWGSSFILMKRGLETFSYIQVAALRMFLTFLFLFPIGLKFIGKMEKKSFLPILSVGLLGNFIPAFLFTRAQMGLSSSITGMLNSLTPLFTLVLGVLLFKNKTRWVNVVGIIIGFAGACGLLWGGKNFNSGGNWNFGLLVTLATICYGLSVNIIKNYLQEIKSFQVVSLAFLFVGPPAGIFLFSTDITHRLTTVNGAWGNLGYILILAVVGTGLSVILFNELIKMTNALFASSVTYLIPVVAMLWGKIDGEDILLSHILSILLIFAGIYLVNKKAKVIPDKKLANN